MAAWPCPRGRVWASIPTRRSSQNCGSAEDTVGTLLQNYVAELLALVARKLGADGAVVRAAVPGHDLAIADEVDARREALVGAPGILVVHHDANGPAELEVTDHRVLLV